MNINDLFFLLLACNFHGVYQELNAAIFFRPSFSQNHVFFDEPLSGEKGFLWRKLTLGVLEESI